jgi:hypothetical protein
VRSVGRWGKGSWKVRRRVAGGRLSCHGCRAHFRNCCQQNAYIQLQSRMEDTSLHYTESLWTCMRRCVRVEFYDYVEGIPLRSVIPAWASAATPSHLGHSLQVSVPCDNCSTMQKGSIVVKYSNLDFLATNIAQCKKEVLFLKYSDLDFVADWSLCPPPWGAPSRKTPHCRWLGLGWGLKILGA